MNVNRLVPIARRVAELDQSFWAAQTEDQMDNLRTATDRALARATTLWMAAVIGGLAVGSLVGVRRVVGLGFAAVSGQAMLSGVLFGALGAVLASLVVTWLSRTLGHDGSALAKLSVALKPLTGSECATALAHASTCPEAAAYRTQVLRTGRAFLTIDLAVMTALRSEQQQRESDARDAELRRELHGVAYTTRQPGIGAPHST